MRVWAWMLVACAGSDPAADRVAFRDLDCARIVDVGLRDECVVYAVRADPAVSARCGDVTSPVMRDECWFSAVDAAELTGADAMRGCMTAGRFDEACRGNAVSREISRLPPMPEAQLAYQIERIQAFYRRPRREVPDLVRRRIAAVGEGAPEAAPAP